MSQRLNPFHVAFQALTNNAPFPWQVALYERFAQGDFPKTACLPTGLGKTSIIAIWLIALANHPERTPRRLVYVVNRRTVVDQTTDEVERYRDALQRPELAELAEQLCKLCALNIGDQPPLAISTLRGQYADNREWSIDPARPAVICGTVDMIGSRLLFSGYGIGFKSKPLHAGFLGQDVLLVHDEAHLEQPFQELLKTIEKEQAEAEQLRASSTASLPWKPLRVIELTATPRSRSTDSEEAPFELSDADEKHPVVRQRIRAIKMLALRELKDLKKLAAELVEHAISLENSGSAVLVFARTVEDVMAVMERLEKRKLKCKPLTGTLRGKERDDLVKDPVFARFLPPSNRSEVVPPASGTVYLVCTSAGEVGVNISADHLVCDLSPFDSMAQRFGRVNRFGVRFDSTITVLYPAEFDSTKPLDQRREKTLALMRQLGSDASPQALRQLDPQQRVEAFTPTPTILPATDILFDSWALTTITDKLPGRPPVERYLHGLADWEPPQTQVAWREEVGVLCGALLDDYPPKVLLEAFPLRPHELLRDRTDRVFDRLKKLPEGLLNPKLPVWVISSDGEIRPTTVEEIVANDKDGLAEATILLPPALGGLRDGMLNVSSHVANDVSCEPLIDQEPLRLPRFRWRSEEPAGPPPPTAEGMRLVMRIDTRPDIDTDMDLDEDLVGTVEQPTGDSPQPSPPVLSYRYWYWYERLDRSDDPGGSHSRRKITWQHHTDDVTANATRIADKLLRHNPELHTALISAARWHDLGKRRVLWQRSIGRPIGDETWYAKSDPAWPSDIIRTAYRHEFGSLVDLHADAALNEEFQSLCPELQELVQHLIAVHHGYGRPHFPVLPQDRTFDPNPRGVETSRLASEVPRRFARLQRHYGRWGLAYVESLLRAADAAASAHPSDCPPAEAQS